MNHRMARAGVTLLAALFTAATAASAAAGAPDPGRFDFFDDFTAGLDRWNTWRVATWSEHNMQTGHDRTFVEDDKLNLVFVNDSQQGWLGAAIQTRKEDFGYGRWEASLKPSDVPGVLNSMYTIDWGDGSANHTRQEIDIEFLTHTFDDEYPGEVWIALHARGRDSLWFSQPLDINPSEQFNTWGWDIRPTHIDYLLNGQVIYTYVYAENDITFDAPYMLKFNVWTSEGWWIQGPPPPDVETIYQIDWVGFTELENLGPMLGDMNADGARDTGDVAAFVLALTDPDAFEAQYGFDPALAGDVNGDGVLDTGDVTAFVDLTTNHPVPGPASGSVPEPGTLTLMGVAALLLMRRRR